VAGRDHDAAVEAEVVCGEIDRLGTAQAEFGNVRTPLRQPPYQGPAQSITGQSDVLSHHHLFGLQKGTVGAADAVGHVFIQLGWNLAADVVGLETAQFAHDPRIGSWTG